MPTTAATEITEWIASQKQAMIDLLRAVVNIDSGSYDKAGVDAVGARFEQHFAEHGISTWREPHDAFGDAARSTVTPTTSRSSHTWSCGVRTVLHARPSIGMGRR